MAESTPYYNAAVLRTVLRACVERAGGQRALARDLGISQRDISQALSGLRPASAALAAALGFQRHVRPRQVVYLYTEPQQAAS